MTKGQLVAIAAKRTRIPVGDLEALVDSGMLSGRRIGNRMVLNRGIPTLSIDELSILNALNLRNLMERNVPRTQIPYYKKKVKGYADAQGWPVINLEARCYRMPFYLHQSKQDSPILISARPFPLQSVIQLSKVGRDKKLSPKQVREAYVLNTYAKVRQNRLAEIYQVSPETLSWALRSYKKMREIQIEKPYLQKIIQKRGLDDHRLLAINEAAARLNINRETARRLLREKLLDGYKENINGRVFCAIPYSSVVSKIRPRDEQDRLLTGAEFFRAVGWTESFTRPWQKAEECGIRYIALTNMSGEATSPRTYFRLCRIPESQVEVARAIATR